MQKASEDQHVDEINGMQQSGGYPSVNEDPDPRLDKMKLTTSSAYQQLRPHRFTQIANTEQRVKAQDTTQPTPPTQCEQPTDPLPLKHSYMYSTGSPYHDGQLDPYTEESPDKIQDSPEPILETPENPK